jgi:hypothetical protein
MKPHFCTQFKYFSLALILSCWVSNTLKAQVFDIGVSGGVSVYQGDLSDENLSGYLEDLNAGAGAFLRWNATPSFSLRANFFYTVLEATDADGRNSERDLSFRSPLSEVSLLIEYQPFRFPFARGTMEWMPYVTGGASYFFFNPETFSPVSNRFVELQPLGTEGQGLPGYDAPYALRDWALPFGFGVKFRISQKWTFGLEWVSRKTFTDYIDDVGNTTVVYRDVLIGNGFEAALLSNKNIGPADDPDQTYVRGGAAQDWFHSAFLSVSYGLGGGGGPSGSKRYRGRALPCPVF